jgi:hypothetical protein
VKIPNATKGYEERFCAFIDFLGFASAVEKGIWTPDEILSAMHKAAKVSGGDEDVVQVTQFSDSLILSTKVDNDWGLYNVVSTAFFLAIELANHGILLRGGITKGEMYHKEMLAFGPAFIRAYRLEQAASTPRIIIDEGIVEYGPWPEPMEAQEVNEMLEISLPRDSDGWRYVDYLSPQHVSEFDDGKEGLERHYSTLRRLVAEHKGAKDPSLRTKYGWLDEKLKKHGR